MSTLLISLYFNLNPQDLCIFCLFFALQVAFFTAYEICLFANLSNDKTRLEKTTSK